MRSTNADILKITTKHYYYKPVQALFRAFEIAEYLETKVPLKSPVMDIGSGDGTFGSMLQESGILNSIRVSLEFSLTDIKKGKNQNKLQGSIQADISNAPIKSGRFSSVFANGVLMALRTEKDIDRSLSEIFRLLQDNGLFFVSLNTSNFFKNLPIPKLLTKSGMSGIAKYYLQMLKCRLTHNHTFPESVWREKLETAGFRIENVRYYFTPRQASWWNFLSLQIFRVFTLLRVPGKRIATRVANLEEKIFRPVFEKEFSIPQSQKKAKAGYLLFVARKLSNQSAKSF